MEKHEFIEAIGNLAIEINKEVGTFVLPSVVIAQACLETGYGSSELMMQYNAPFGIKYSTGCGYNAYSAKTSEFYGANKVTETDCFRAYETLKDAVYDHHRLLTTSSYYSAITYQTNYETALLCLKNYATDPNYVDKLKTIIENYNLTEYDYYENININTETLKVLKGEYGNGEERKLKLADNYNVVQANVNRILELAKGTAKGKYGNGETRKNALKNDYELVQYCINNNLI